VIGIDPHKSSHTSAALDTHTHDLVDRVRIDATVVEYRRLLAWAKRVCEQPGGRRWAIENAEGLGRHLAQWLLARGEAVVDVPATATARVRELSRGGKRKTDVLNAAAAASVAAAQGDAKPVMAEGVASVLKMLDERRRNLTQQRTRCVNQLHALLRELLPGGARTDLTADHGPPAAGRGDHSAGPRPRGGPSRQGRAGPGAGCRATPGSRPRRAAPAARRAPRLPAGGSRRRRRGCPSPRPPGVPRRRSGGQVGPGVHHQEGRCQRSGDVRGSIQSGRARRTGVGTDDDGPSLGGAASGSGPRTTARGQRAAPVSAAAIVPASSPPEAPSPKLPTTSRRASPVRAATTSPIRAGPGSESTTTSAVAPRPERRR
jgi:hypothetical protein